MGLKWHGSCITPCVFAPQRLSGATLTGIYIMRRLLLLSLLVASAVFAQGRGGHGSSGGRSYGGGGHSFSGGRSYSGGGHAYSGGRSYSGGGRGYSSGRS